MNRHCQRIWKERKVQALSKLLITSPNNISQGVNSNKTKKKRLLIWPQYTKILPLASPFHGKGCVDFSYVVKLMDRFHTKSPKRWYFNKKTEKYNMRSLPSKIHVKCYHTLQYKEEVKTRLFTVKTCSLTERGGK